MKKRIISVFLVVAMLTCTAAVSEELSRAAVALGFVRTVSKYGTVWLRTGGGMSYTPIGYATNGDSCTIHYKGNYWYRITLTSGLCKGMTGWMYYKYVDSVNLKNKNSKNSWGAMARIRDKYEFKNIKLRSGPGSWYSSRGNVEFDDPIIILSKANSAWYIAQIGYTKKYGYIYKAHIKNGSLGEALTETVLHKKASASSVILDYLLTGDDFEVLNVQSKWSKIRFQGVTGYILNSDYDFLAYVPYVPSAEET